MVYIEMYYEPSIHKRDQHYIIVSCLTGMLGVRMNRKACRLLLLSQTALKTLRIAWSLVSRSIRYMLSNFVST